MSGQWNLRQRASAGMVEVAGSGVRLPLVGVRPMARVTPIDPTDIVVRDVRRYSPPETLYFTGALGDVDLTMGQALAHLVTPGWRVLPRRSVLQGMSKGEFDYLGFLDRGTSEQAAVAAACAWLGVPPTLRGRGARVLDVDPDGPASALLPDDVIVAVNGTAVQVAADAVRLLRELAPTSGALCEVLRTSPTDEADAVGIVRTVRIGVPRGHGARPSYGLRLATHRPQLDMPFDIEVRLDPDSAGPSGGLMLALAVLDVLTPGSITGGLHVAGTGTITMDGEVGEVAWVGLKARAASRTGVDVLLVPPGAQHEAGAAVGPTTRVVAVTRLAEAVAFLIGQGGEKPVLPSDRPDSPLSPGHRGS